MEDPESTRKSFVNKGDSRETTPKMKAADPKPVRKEQSLQKDKKNYDKYKGYDGQQADDDSSSEEEQEYVLPDLPKIVNYQPPQYSIGDLSELGAAELKDFRILQMVGKGGFGKVYQVVRESDNRIFALKTMRKDTIMEMGQAKNVVNEKNILRKCGESAFVVHLLTSFQDSIHLFLVQEFLPGGNLLSYIRHHGNLANDHARFYAAEIFLGLSFLHSKGIVYRDLKPDNILFDTIGHIRIADLGFAKEINQNPTNTFCGTPSYLAPEVILKKPYGYEVDWWAFGVIIFQLCCGCSPFQESKPIATFARILKCAIRWPPDPQSFFTNDAFDLISWLLEIERENRPFQDEIKTHPWFDGVDFAAMQRKEISPPKTVRDLATKNSILIDPNIGDSVKRVLSKDQYQKVDPAQVMLSEARSHLRTDSYSDIFAGF